MDRYYCHAAWLNGVNLMLTQGNTYKPENENKILSSFGNFSLFGLIDMQLICFLLIFAVFVFLMKKKKLFAVCMRQALLKKRQP